MGGSKTLPSKKLAKPKEQNSTLTHTPNSSSRHETQPPNSIITRRTTPMNWFGKKKPDAPSTTSKGSSGGGGGSSNAGATIIKLKESVLAQEKRWVIGEGRGHNSFQSVLAASLMQFSIRKAPWFPLEFHWYILHLYGQLGVFRLRWRQFITTLPIQFFLVS